MNRPAAITMDARSLQPATRTEQILEAFDKLAINSILELNEESDPRALRNELAQLRPGKFSWDARNLGSNRWTIRVERIDENAEPEALLQHVAPFGSAKAATLRDLARQMTERTYRAGETIFDEGEVWPYLGVVKSGKVILTLLSPDGKTHTLGDVYKRQADGRDRRQLAVANRKQSGNARILRSLSCRADITILTLWPRSSILRTA